MVSSISVQLWSKNNGLKIPEINNSYILSQALFCLNDVMKAHTVLLHLDQDVIHIKYNCYHNMPDNHAISSEYCRNKIKRTFMKSSVTLIAISLDKCLLHLEVKGTFFKLGILKFFFF